MRISIIIMLTAALLAARVGAAEARRILLDRNSGAWQVPAPARAEPAGLRIPAGFTGELLAPVSPLPEPRQEMMISFDFRLSADFKPEQWNVAVEVIWLDQTGRPVGRHHQHPWFTFPVPALYDQWLPFHRPVTAESVPKDATSAQLCIKVSGSGTGELEIRDISFVSFYRLRSKVFANWFEPGEPIAFYGTLPAGTTALKGVVTDTDNQIVTEATVPREEFEKNGWRCTIDRPGFYTVRFFHLNETGKATPVIQEYYAQRIRGNRFQAEQKYERAIQNFAVTSTKARPMNEVPRQLGISTVPRESALPYRLGSSVADDLRLRRLIGANFMRLHALSWDEVEKVPGVYDWAPVDRMLATAMNNGIPQANIDIVLLDTPRFYTSRPENTAATIYAERYQFFPPNNWNAWSRFVTAVVKRYPNIRSWEIWNEPHLPGHSIFWKGSPETYLEMLKTGYQAIKRVNPDKPVAFGGVGMNYQPFYRRILELGGGEFFDVLPLHGTWTVGEPYLQMNREFKVSPKRIINNEWHTTLFTSTDPVILSEKLLSFNMVLDFLNMMRSGVESIAYHNGFGPRWHGGTEHEMVDFRKQDGAQIEGIFRTYPNQEPKLASLVLRNLYDRFSGRITFRNAYYFNDGSLQAALLESDSGPLLVFWNMGKTAIKPPAELAAAIRSARLLNQEGAELEFSPRMTVAPQKIYYAEGADMTQVSGWSNILSRIEPYQEIPVMEDRCRGSYHSGKLFDTELNLLPGSEQLPWITLTDYQAVIPSQSSPDYRGRFALGLNPEGLELCAEVEDSLHRPLPEHDSGKAIPYWNGDSLQFAIDCSGKGKLNSMTEFLLSGHGNHFTKTMIASVGGDIPDRSSKPGEPLKFGRSSVEHKGGKTVYKLRIDASELYPFTFTADKPLPLRFSLLVNNNDGAGRLGYLTWGGGIGDLKSPARFGTLGIRGSGEQVAGQEALCNRFQQAKLDFINPGKSGASVKVTATIETKDGEPPMIGSGVTSAPVKAVPGLTYVISFEARGDGMLEAFAAGTGMERLNFGPSRVRLTGEYARFVLETPIPAEGGSLQCCIFTWRQPESKFEIRNFQIREKAE